MTENKRFFLSGLVTIENSFFVLFLKSTQYKKLAPNSFVVHILKFEISKSHERNETKNIRLLVFSF